MYSLNASLFLDNYKEIIDYLKTQRIKASLNEDAFCPDINGKFASIPLSGDFIPPYLNGDYLFTSFHVKEQMQGNYKEQMKEICRFAKSLGKKIIADVSKKSLEYFGASSILDLTKEYGIDILRLDYGFSLDELVQLGQKLPICINASTLRSEELEKLIQIMNSGKLDRLTNISISNSPLSKSAASKLTLHAMHNYYPRRDTGLDDAFFKSQNSMFFKENMEIFAFIPSDIIKRSPIFEGLPTLEKHRLVPPYVAYLDLVKNFEIKHVFVGDGITSHSQLNLISLFHSQGVISIPVKLRCDKYRFILNQDFTIRYDSPRLVKRLEESRAYAQEGQPVEADNTCLRTAGSITIDNHKYLRYSGEIQIIVEDLPADERVNVIATIDEAYLGLLDIIKNSDKIRLIEL